MSFKPFRKNQTNSTCDRRRILYHYRDQDLFCSRILEERTKVKTKSSFFRELYNS
jgi:hypothetical protein